LLISEEPNGTHSKRAIKTTRTAIRTGGILTQIQTYNISYATISTTATLLTAKYSQVSQEFSRPHNHQLIINALVTIKFNNANGS
jgi:hypothetical protein